MQVLCNQAFDGERRTSLFDSDGKPHTFTLTASVASPLGDPTLSLKLILHDGQGNQVAKKKFKGPITAPLVISGQSSAVELQGTLIASRLITANADISST